MKGEEHFLLLLECHLKGYNATDWNICRIKGVKKTFSIRIVSATSDDFAILPPLRILTKERKCLYISSPKNSSRLMVVYLYIVLYVGFLFYRTMIRHKYAAHNEGNTPFFVYPVSEGTVDMVGTCAKGRMEVAT